MRYICISHFFALTLQRQNKNNNIMLYGELQTIKQSTKIKLRKGSIRKLIGKKLTWEDEPFEFNI